MRKQGLIFLIIVAALVIFVNSVVTGRWLEQRREKFGGRITGKDLLDSLLLVSG